ncbi:MAG: hypothetical protein Kow00129_06930 [Thermoleophilia bacterium]
MSENGTASFQTNRRTAKVAGGLGLLLSAPLVSASYLAFKAFGVPFPAFEVFDWMARALPGPLVTFGIDSMVRVLVILGFNIKDTAKLAEQMMAVFGFLVTAALVAGAYFYLIRTRLTARSLALGSYAGLLLGFPVVLITLDVYATATVEPLTGAAWLVLLFAAWGLALGWTHLRSVGPATAPEEGESAAAPVRVKRISRRRFLVEIGGTAATITVAGAGLASYLRLTTEEIPLDTEPPIPPPNADSPVLPVEGTRPEYTPLREHYRIDINTLPPRIDEAEWTLQIRGLVGNPLDLTLDDIRAYPSVQRFITLGCISNPIGGPLISTTLWTGTRLSEILAAADVDPRAQYVHVTSEDGFYETIPLELLRSDDRIMLTYEFDGQPLPQEHGFPLRVWIPGRYGMKQPKWIIGLELTESDRPGYWVERGWSKEAIVNTTSVIDTVVTDLIEETPAGPTVPVGGIAWAGDRGVTRVQVRADQGPWQDAQLREPLSDVTWVLWRYDWLFSPGEHTLEVRAQDGTGEWQTEARSGTYPDGATGLHEYEADL